MFEQLFFLHQDTSVLTDEDLVINGVKCCTECHTPVQQKIMFHGKEYLMRCLCKCQLEAQQELESGRNAAAFKRKVEYLKRGLISPKYREMTFSESSSALPWAQKYVDNFPKYYLENVGLMLLGGAGTGKTFAAACIANALIELGKNVLMANVLYLTDKMGALYAKDRYDFIDNLQRYDLLIIDDFGAERTSDFIAEQMYNLVETRYSSGKPMIMTSNITPEQLKNCPDLRYQRTYDRIKEICVPVILNGESRRKSLGNERYSRLKSELSL